MRAFLLARGARRAYISNCNAAVVAAYKPRKASTMAKQTKANATATGPRGGRIAPLQDKVVTRLKKGSASVASMAAAFKCTERDVRLAIDRARNKGHAIKRVEKGTFGF